MIALIREITSDLVPDDTPDSEIDSLVTTVITLTLGLGVQVELLQGKRAAEASWRGVREQLLVMVDAAGRG